MRSSISKRKHFRSIKSKFSFDHNTDIKQSSTTLYQNPMSTVRTASSVRKSTPLIACLMNGNDISMKTYRHQPQPRPQQGKRRCLTGVPSATAYPEELSSNIVIWLTNHGKCCDVSATTFFVQWEYGYWFKQNDQVEEKFHHPNKSKRMSSTPARTTKAQIS